MKILVIGSGGREHALVWKLKKSPQFPKIYCAPGNGGIAQDAELVQIKADDLKGLLDFALKEKIGLTIVGPEAPLAEEEASILVVSDGINVIPLASSQDHKRVFDGYKGPNTGGMGAYSPAPAVSEEIHK